MSSTGEFIWPNEFEQAVRAALDLPCKRRPAAKELLFELAAADRRLNAAALRVFVVLVTGLWWQLGYTRHVGSTELQVATGLSRASVARGLQLLQNTGHVVRDQNRSYAPFEANHYAFPGILQLERREPKKEGPA